MGKRTDKWGQSRNTRDEARVSGSCCTSVSGAEVPPDGLSCWLIGLHYSVLVTHWALTGRWNRGHWRWQRALACCEGRGSSEQSRYLWQMKFKEGHTSSFVSPLPHPIEKLFPVPLSIFFLAWARSSNHEKLKTIQEDAYLLSPRYCTRLALGWLQEAWIKMDGVCCHLDYESLLNRPFRSTKQDFNVVFPFLFFPQMSGNVARSKLVGQKRWCVLPFKIAQTDSWAAATLGSLNSQLHSVATLVLEMCLHQQNNTMNHPFPLWKHPKRHLQLDRPSFRVSGCFHYCPYLKPFTAVCVS